ncbi:MAG: class I SAM-dependent methyltransferase [Oscillospiraceae bacterium]|nr:class I SAM-dependent methyltransferase [Oscillospiraceae bacterium]
MRVSDNWKDYELIDCSEGERLERWGKYILIRPDPQVIWSTPKTNGLWYNADARYIRSSSGGGSWDVYKKLPDVWQIGYSELKFNIKPMGFKHTGIFPEQAVNWDMTARVIADAHRNDIKMLNLFAYTGGATVSAMNAGATVTHVDASKGMVQWAKENAESSGVSDRPVRWLVDDCKKFVEREIRRGNRYDIIIMDPPSYGRGPGGEVWKLENEVYSLCGLCAKLLSDDALLFLINSYTTGLSPSVMSYILGSLIVPQHGGKVSADEIGLPVTDSGLVLPSGASAYWTR